MRGFLSVIMIIFGLLLALAGGGCVIAFILFGNGRTESAVFFIALVVAGVGVALVMKAFNMFGHAPGARDITSTQVKDHLDAVTRKHLAELNRDLDGDGGKGT